MKRKNRARKKIRFVNVAEYGFVAEPRYYFFGWAKSSKIMGRASAVKALARAKRFLPKRYTFKIWDCKRPYAVQALMIESFKKRLRQLYGDLSPQDKKRLLIRFSGGLVRKVARLDTHRNGGSFDLTIVDRRGHELWMGTDHDDLTKKAAMDYYEEKKALTIMEKEARKNRRLFKKVLKKAGFENYTPEWWHWSYGK